MLTSNCPGTWNGVIVSDSGELLKTRSTKERKKSTAPGSINRVEIPFDRNVKFSRDNAFVEKITDTDRSPDRLPVLATIFSLNFRQKFFPNEYTDRSDYSRMVTIERRALRSEAMGLYLGAACKLSLWSERLRKKRATIRAQKTALKLFVSEPRSSRLTSRSTLCRRFSSNLKYRVLGAIRFADKTEAEACFVGRPGTGDTPAEDGRTKHGSL